MEHRLVRGGDERAALRGWTGDEDRDRWVVGVFGERLGEVAADGVTVPGSCGGYLLVSKGPRHKKRMKCTFPDLGLLGSLLPAKLNLDQGSARGVAGACTRRNTQKGALLRQQPHRERLPRSPRILRLRRREREREDGRVRHLGESAQLVLRVPRLALDADDDDVILDLLLDAPLEDASLVVVVDESEREDQARVEAPLAVLGDGCDEPGDDGALDLAAVESRWKKLRVGAASDAAGEKGRVEREEDVVGRFERRALGERDERAQVVDSRGDDGWERELVRLVEVVGKVLAHLASQRCPCETAAGFELTHLRVLVRIREGTAVGSTEFIVKGRDSAEVEVRVELLRAAAVRRALPEVEQQLRGREDAEERRRWTFRLVVERVVRWEAAGRRRWPRGSHVRFGRLLTVPAAARS